jgi:hypothetical protein
MVEGVLEVMNFASQVLSQAWLAGDILVHFGHVTCEPGDW